MVKRINQIRNTLIFLFILVIIILLILQMDWFWRLIYPLEYKDIIEFYSREYKLDPYLVSALIFVESKFIPEAVSHKGALGLMQIMPDTGKWIAEQLQYNDFEIDLLLEPEINIRFGTWYLGSLNQEFNNNSLIVLAAYNAGRGNVRKWLEQSWDGKEHTISKLPYKETRDYVKQVLAVYKQYKRLYNF